ncbi:MAG: hypothetical protein LM577_05615 [Thermoproteaceae archaeon]|nr:hypothetical protein [Thermoproteaceae archaeon]
MRALYNVSRREGLNTLFVRVKDCEEGEVLEVGVPEGAERYLVSHISSVLHFTVERGFRVSLDLLQEASANTLSDLIEWSERNYPPDVSRWAKLRLRMLQRFVDGSKIGIPLCLKRYDEGIRRLVVGLLYVLRPYIISPIMLDDALAFVLNERYGEAWSAMMRPYIISVNRYLETRELLAFEPIVVSPCETPLYRFCSRNRYVVIWSRKLNEVPFEEIQRLAGGP